MRLAIISTILYFPLILIYKLWGQPLNELTGNYWINSYWLVTAIWLMLVFIDIRKNSLNIEYKLVSLFTSIYWGVMVALRVYLYFHIDKHYELIDRAGSIGAGVITILIGLIFLTAKIWHRK